MPCAFMAAACSLLPRIASRPPCTFGCRVFTLPSIISGKPVSSETSFTFSPAPAIAFAVPPVETSSTPCPASAFANSISPALSETDSNARVTRRGWSVISGKSWLLRQPGSMVFGSAKPPKTACENLPGQGFGAVIPGSRRSSGLCLDGRDVTDILGPLRMPGIVSGLHPRPDSRAIAEKLAEANRNGRGYRLFFLQDVVKMLARNPEQSGNLRLGPASGGNDV